MSPSTPPDINLDDIDADTLFRLLEVSANGIVFVDGDWAVVYANASALETFARNEADVAGQDLRRLFDEAGAITLSQGADGALRRAQVVRQNGNSREIAFWSIPVEVEGEKLRAVVFEDVTASIQRERAADALVKIASSLAFDQPVESTLDDIARRALESTHAIACAVAIIEEDPLRIRSAGSAGAITTDWSASETAWSAGVYSPTPTAYRERRTVVESFAKQRMLADPAFHAMHEEFRQSAWDSAVAHPLLDVEDAIGVLTAYYAGPAPNADEVELLEALARHAATAARSARLFEEARVTAAMVERQALAHELHDSVSQALYGITLGAHTARQQLPDEPTAAAASIDYVLSLADGALAEMRALLFELSPDSLEREGLRAALGKQTNALRTRLGLIVNERFDSEPALPTEAKNGLYRIAQAALRHLASSGVSSPVDIALYEESDGIVFEVAVGTPPTDHATSLAACESIAERVARIGAALEVVLPGVSDGLRIRLPLHAASGAQHSGGGAD